MQYLYLPATDYRTEAMRVIQDKAFIVQSFNAERNLWISQKEWKHLESAIADAMTWYPMPQGALQNMVAGCINHMGNPGKVTWCCESDEGDICDFEERMTKECFTALVKSLAKKDGFELEASYENVCIFNLPNIKASLEGRFTSDKTYIDSQIMTPDCTEDLIEGMIEELQGHLGGQIQPDNPAVKPNAFLAVTEGYFIGTVNSPI